MRGQAGREAGGVRHTRLETGSKEGQGLAGVPRRQLSVKSLHRTSQPTARGWLVERAIEGGRERVAAHLVVRAHVGRSDARVVILRFYTRRWQLTGRLPHPYV